MTTSNSTDNAGPKVPRLNFVPPSDSMDDALIELRHNLFEAMGIVRLASCAICEPGYDKAETDAWTSLNVAHALLSGIADRLQSSETLLVGGCHGEY